MKEWIKFFLLMFFAVFAISVSAQDKAATQPLSLAGWDLATAPNVTNTHKETGKITYEVEIDSLGNLVNVTVIEKNISDNLAQKCEDALRKMSFVKNANNTYGSIRSKGTVTFVFKVN